MLSVIVADIGTMSSVSAETLPVAPLIVGASSSVMVMVYVPVAEGSLAELPVGSWAVM